ncbi:MAG: T9SS type A sorting domain-containing protein, partial [Bacteroidota bacterium]
GLDLVCLELCNEFGLCDSYTFSFRIERENVDLPFFDDFSRITFRPDLALWQNEDVLINRTYGINPPSLGVATFDAVGPRGQPYENSGGSFVPRDFLTSAGINMAGAGDVVLTFYAQPRGAGNRPEVQDSLVLQFLTEGGNWRTIWSIPGLSSGESNCSDRPFIGYRSPVSSEFNYNGFQFRFFNRSNQTGALDHWNLDYIRLDDLFTEFNFRDVALIKPPLTVTAPYTSVPYRQFAAAGEQLIRPDVEIAVWNHSILDTLPVNLSNFQIAEQNTIQELLSATQFVTLEDGAPSGEPFVNLEDLSNRVFFEDYANGLLGLPDNGNETYRVRNVYNLAGDNFVENSTPGIAGSVTANNRAATETIFADYYAYDDGTAELSIAALPGQTVVQRYEAFVPEVMRGISVRLPRAREQGAGNQVIRLVVYLTDSLQADSEPDFSLEVNPIYVEDFYQDSLDGFTSYPFPDSLDIPVGPFYVGWQQVTDADPGVPLGLDRNNNIDGTRFFSNGGNWFALDGCSLGAVMIRPLVGNSPVLDTDVDDYIQTSFDQFLEVFPNPVDNVVFIRRKDGGHLQNLDWQLFNMAGQIVKKSIRGEPQIQVTELPAGIYFLHCFDRQSGQQSQHKLVIQ